MKSNVKTQRPADHLVEDGYFLCRPAMELDLDGIMEVVGSEDIASMIADEAFQTKRIKSSQDTLSGSRSWRDGLLMLVTEFRRRSAKSEPPEVVGSAGLNACAGGYWVKRECRERPDGARGAECLTFESFPKREISIEFSGTCVARRYRSKSIGSLHTVARIVFLLMHHRRIEEGSGRIAYLCANLLPPMDDAGEFPFYEQFVKPLLGNVGYRDADARRYNDPSFFDVLLPGRGGNEFGAEIPFSAVETAIGEYFGMVRNQTRGAERALAKYGFRQVSKYDALDAGRYVEATLDELSRSAKPRRLKLRSASSEEMRMQGEGELCYFAPIGSMKDFVCVRAAARCDDNALWVSSDLFDDLGLSPDDWAIVVSADKRAE